MTARSLGTPPRSLPSPAGEQAARPLREVSGDPLVALLDFFFFRHASQSITSSPTLQWLFPDDSLVYLIREYKGKDRNSVVNDLTRILLQRCAKFINNRLKILGQDTVEEAFHDVIQEMFTQILDLNSDRGDFLQVRFWAALKVIVISTFNRYKKRLEEAKNTVPLSSLAGYERTADDNNTRTFVIHLRTHIEPLSFCVITMVGQSKLVILQYQASATISTGHHAPFGRGCPRPKKP